LRLQVDGGMGIQDERKNQKGGGIKGNVCTWTVQDSFTPFVVVPDSMIPTHPVLKILEVMFLQANYNVPSSIDGSNGVGYCSC
jgi:hypothetical protein